MGSDNKVDFEVGRGVPEDQYLAVAELYYLAFQRKLRQLSHFFLGIVKTFD